MCWRGGVAAAMYPSDSPQLPVIPALPVPLVSSVPPAVTILSSRVSKHPTLVDRTARAGAQASVVRRPIPCGRCHGRHGRSSPPVVCWGFLYFCFVSGRLVAVPAHVALFFSRSLLDRIFFFLESVAVPIGAAVCPPVAAGRLAATPATLVALRYRGCHGAVSLPGRCDRVLPTQRTR